MNLKPIRLDPRYRWDFLKSDINEAYGRAKETLDWAVWDAEASLNSCLVKH